MYDVLLNNPFQRIDWLTIINGSNKLRGEDFKCMKHRISIIGGSICFHIKYLLFNYC